MIYILVKHTIPLDKKEELHKAYESHLRLLEKHGGKVVGDWDVELGPFSEHIMIWATKNLHTYEAALKKITQDPEDTAFREICKPIVSNCQRWLLRPTRYSPLK